MIILLHTSKTMRQPVAEVSPSQPALIAKATELADYIATLSVGELKKTMHISDSLAATTVKAFQEWGKGQTSLAMDSFVGDIYSGLRASLLTNEEREYAQEHLRILSGLYGILRPYDGIQPYRLEMGYRLPDQHYTDLYEFWGDSIAKQLPADDMIVNLAAVEYSRTVLPYVDPARVISPRFLTKDPRTGEPTFVVVHAKIARGAFARWLITTRTTNKETMKQFNDIGYRYVPKLSTPDEPAFVCDEFQGKGLSMRLVN